MGQHKYNPVAIAAKNGELPPKPRKPSKRERDAFLHHLTEDAMRKVCGVAPSDLMVDASYKAWSGMTHAPDFSADKEAET
jgi:hypothetical protein